jgi:uncharacterized protein (DUF1800 family)
VTKDPAMLLWLNGNRNTVRSPNENYARELMELFTLGVNRGYTEQDIREQARALTGWRNRRAAGVGAYDFHYEPRLHDNGMKTVFGKTGNFAWEDACRLCVEHANHPSFFVRKLWSYFVPTPPSDATAAALEHHYVASGLQIRPIVEAILCSPEFHEGPRMVKPPVVLAAGLMRASGRGIENNEWWYRSDRSGQRIYYPPDVSGWNDQRWLDTNTTVGRWDLVGLALAGRMVTGQAADTYQAQSAEQAVAAARAYWGDPDLTAESVGELLAFAQAAVPASGSAVTLARLRAQRFNALRQLLAAGPDYQTC